MPDIGYYTLPVILSFKGIDAQVNAELGKKLTPAAEKAGEKAGESMAKGAKKGAAKAGAEAGKGYNEAFYEEMRRSGAAKEKAQADALKKGTEKLKKTGRSDGTYYSTEFINEVKASAPKVEKAIEEPLKKASKTAAKPAAKEAAKEYTKTIGDDLKDAANTMAKDFGAGILDGLKEDIGKSRLGGTVFEGLAESLVDKAGEAVKNADVVGVIWDGLKASTKEVDYTDVAGTIVDGLKGALDAGMDELKANAREWVDGVVDQVKSGDWQGAADTVAGAVRGAGAVIGDLSTILGEPGEDIRVWAEKVGGYIEGIGTKLEANKAKFTTLLQPVEDLGGLFPADSKIANLAKQVSILRDILTIAQTVHDELAPVEAWLAEKTGLPVDVSLWDRLKSIGDDLTATWENFKPSEKGVTFFKNLGTSIETIPDKKTIVLEAADDEAMTTLQNFGFYVERLPDGQVRIIPQTKQAEELMESWRTDEEGKPVEVGVNADTTAADAALQGFIGRAANTKVNVNVGVLGHGAGETPLAPRATGGGIYGPGGPTSDIIPIWASSGEHVLTAKDVQALGGQSGVYAFRNALHRAAGGAVNSEIQAVGQIASQLGLNMTSGFRDPNGPTISGVPASRSYHGSGAAGDFSNGSGNTPEMLAFAQYMLTNYGASLSELIYSDPGMPQLVNNGRVVPASFYASALRGHRNHVHVAIKAGTAPELTAGTMPLGASGGGGEPTVPLSQGPGGTWTSPSAAWAHLIERESGGDPNIIQGVIDANTGGNEASGLFQIAKGTWKANGGQEFAPTAGEATPEEQAIVAARIFHGNPTGEDWGAGLPGRENASALAAGLTTGSAMTHRGGTGGPLADAAAANKPDGADATKAFGEARKADANAFVNQMTAIGIGGVKETLGLGDVFPDPTETPLFQSIMGGAMAFMPLLEGAMKGKLGVQQPGWKPGMPVDALSQGGEGGSGWMIGGLGGLGVNDIAIPGPPESPGGPGQPGAPAPGPSIDASTNITYQGNVGMGPEQVNSMNDRAQSKATAKVAAIDPAHH